MTDDDDERTRFERVREAIGLPMLGLLLLAMTVALLALNGRH